MDPGEADRRTAGDIGQHRAGGVGGRPPPGPRRRPRIAQQRATRQGAARRPVRRPGAAGWQRTGARQSYAPLPLTAGLLTALYLGVGLATSDIALLCGVGNTMVGSGLHEHNVELRRAKIVSPRKQRHAPPRKAAGHHRA